MNELSGQDLPTVLRTFHQSIVDYHQRALEPLGLFCVQSTGDVVVVHRSGISVARRLQSAEEALLNAHYLGSAAESSKLFETSIVTLYEIFMVILTFLRWFMFSELSKLIRLDGLMDISFLGVC